MKAMILAAGRGERMRPLTDNTPKPLLSVAGKPLILHHIEALVRVGVRDLVINHAWKGEQIEAQLGDGSKFGAHIQYSPEGERALETGGGIVNALSLLGTQAFIVVNGDIFTDFDYNHLLGPLSGLAHLVLVANPEHNLNGDFSLKNNKLHSSGEIKNTFSGIAVYHPDFFQGCRAERFPLAPMLRQAMDQGSVSGELHTGRWMDIGTPERLDEINRMFSENTDNLLE